MMHSESLTMSHNKRFEFQEHTADERVMIADLPTQGVTTVYSRIGDLFAWLCVAGFLGLIVFAIVNRKRA